MNTWMFLIAALFSQDDFLVKQGDIQVPLSDLDAYVYLLGENKRPGFSEQPKQIEQNIFTLLNVNIVYQHIIDKGLNDEPEFQATLKKINDREIDIEPDFLDALELDEDTVSEGIKKYLVKTRYYQTMLRYLDASVSNQQIEQLAREHYLISKKEYVAPAKRDLSVIMLDSHSLNGELIESLAQADQNEFEQKATELSVDPSKELNQGHWGQFREIDFNYPFKDTVFKAAVGVIPEVLTDNNHAYIIRVNDIQDSQQMTFEEVKGDLIKELKNDVVVKKFQSIINAQGRKELEVNPELTAHVFERYKVFKND